jgi:hypothetical protein
MARKKSKQDALIDELLQDCKDPKDILGQNGLLKQLTKRLIERTLQAELTGHLGYEPYAPRPLRNSWKNRFWIFKNLLPITNFGYFSLGWRLNSSMPRNKPISTASPYSSAPWVTWPNPGEKFNGRISISFID